MLSRVVVSRVVAPSRRRNSRRILTKSGLGLAALFFALVLIPGAGWASVTNCPTEPKQGVPISSGETYFGSNCVLKSASDVDSFTFNASAGDVWRVATAITTGGYPNNICLQLYAPGSSTAQYSGCSNSVDNVVSVATNQPLTVAGVYTILVTETLNNTIDYGLSLERLSHTPPDGVPLTLGQTVTTALPAPTAQGTYTFYGTTTGTYKITSSMTSGYPLNLCFALYQPNGSSALTPACTNSVDNVITVTENVTPTQTGTYVLVIYEPAENETVDYNLSVSCLTGVCKQPPPPPCTLKDTASYNATTDTLTMSFTIGNTAVETWNAWLTYQNTMESLFSVSQPITNPPKVIVETKPALSKEGVVGVLSTLTSSTGGITCSSWVVLNTGKP
jgi:hypothetical protein